MPYSILKKEGLNLHFHSNAMLLTTFKFQFNWKVIKIL